MVALYDPMLFPNSNMGWSIEDYIINHHETSHDDIQRCDSGSKSEGNNNTTTSSGGGGDDNAIGKVKKLNHNASERDRRKRMNGLYSSLRSVLPSSDQKAKLSIPNTVSQVLKYIPELQKELERLQKKKQELTSKLNHCQKMSSSSSSSTSSLEFNKRRRVSSSSSDDHHYDNKSYLLASQVGERDIVIQMCSKEGNNKNLFVDALSCLEQEGLVLLHSSTFQTFQDKLNFYTLHLQVQGTQIMEVDKLKEKLLITNL